MFMLLTTCIFTILIDSIVICFGVFKVFFGLVSFLLCILDTNDCHWLRKKVEENGEKHRKGSSDGGHNDCYASY